MGRAEIITDHGSGLYTIQPIIDTADAAAQITALEAENATIATRLTELSAEITAAVNAVAYQFTVVQAAIAGGDDTATKAAQKALNDAQVDLEGLRQSENWLQLRQTVNTKRIEYLTEQSTLPGQIQAWCADLTEGASGYVGTVEIGRIGDQVIIKPGAPTHSDTDDGRMQPTTLSSDAAAIYNYVVLPAINKWRPRFRTGVASNIDTSADTMTVTLDALTAGGLSCNQATVLTVVPVDYMTCNAEAFADDDHVVVEFTGQDWSDPQVIGFVSAPKSCTMRNLLFIPVKPSSIQLGTYPAYPWWYGAPFFNGVQTVDWSSQADGGRYDIDYDCPPGIVIDLDTGQRVPIYNPDTGTEITQTVRGTEQDGIYTFPGVYPSVIASILGVPFVRGTKPGESGGINGRDIAIPYISSSGSIKAFKADDEYGATGSVKGKPFPDCGVNGQWVQDGVTHTIITQDDPEFYETLVIDGVDHQSELSYDWDGTVSSSSFTDVTISGCSNFVYQTDSDRNLLQSGGTAVLPASTEARTMADGSTVVRSDQYDYEEDVVNYIEYKNYAISTSHLAQQELQQSYAWGSEDFDQWNFNTRLGSTIHAGRQFTFELINVREEEIGSVVVDEENTYHLRAMVNAPLIDGGEQYATEDYDYAAGSWSSYGDATVKSLLGGAVVDYAFVGYMMLSSMSVS